MKKLILILILSTSLGCCGILKSYAQDIKAYQNYDFVAGDKIIFSDDLSDSQTGEFSKHWKLNGGQGVVNMAGDEKAFFITKYYTALSPRVKTPNYLPKEFTIEFDTWLDAAYDSNNGISICFKNGDDCSVQIITNNSQWICENPEGRLTGELPKGVVNDTYFNKWHHIAIAVKGGQIKIYCDQYRVLVVPEVSFKANMLMITGDASDGMNMMFKNFKLASGGDMNMIGKAFTDGKYISHGINFDVNKSTIKPASMGEINAIAKILQDNPALKFEVGGHTDSDGDDASNLKLSEARANAVKAQLVALGIDPSHLTTKGYGETKPIADNKTFEGKAENRRVEFAKLL